MMITRMINGFTYSLDIPNDDRATLRLIIELQRDSAQYLLDCAMHDLDSNQPYHIDSDRPLTQFDYNGDHVDYNSAAADLIIAVTHMLCDQIDDSAINALIRIFNEDDDFCMSMETADFDSPMMHIFNVDYNDEQRIVALRID